MDLVFWRTIMAVANYDRWTIGSLITLVVILIVAFILIFAPPWKSGKSDEGVEAPNAQVANWKAEAEKAANERKAEFERFKQEIVNLKSGFEAKVRGTEHATTRKAEETKKAEEAAEKAKKIMEKTNIFLTNIDAWVNNEFVQDAAQLRLAPQWEATIRQLIEANWTCYDREAAAYAGRRIWDIAGDRATAVVLKYVNDPRVVVSENAKKWYHDYCPKAILDRIEGNCSIPPNVVPDATSAPDPMPTPTPMPTAPVRRTRPRINVVPPRSPATPTTSSAPSAAGPSFTEEQAQELEKIAQAAEWKAAEFLAKFGPANTFTTTYQGDAWRARELADKARANIRR